MILFSSIIYLYRLQILKINLMISKIKNFLLLSFLIGIAGLATIIFTVTLIYPTLPDVESLSKYRPKEPLQIFTKDNYLIQEFPL